MPSARRARWTAPPVPGSLKPEGHFLEGQPGPESGHKGFGGREPLLPDDSGLPSPQPLAPFPHRSGTNSPHLWQEAPGHPPRNRQEDANGWRPSPDGANTAPWALVLWGVGGVVRAEEGWGRPQVLAYNVGVKASFLHLLRWQVTWETVKALWGGTPEGGGRRADPRSPSKRKCSRGGGDESLSKGFRGRWIDRHQAGVLSPQPRASEPNPACPTAPPAPACPQTPSPSPEPKAASEWFRAGAGPSPPSSLETRCLGGHHALGRPRRFRMQQERPSLLASALSSPSVGYLGPGVTGTRPALEGQTHSPTPRSGATQRQAPLGLWSPSSAQRQLPS